MPSLPHVLLVAACALTPYALAAQTPAAGPPRPATHPTEKFGGPNVGDLAPDFTFAGVTRYGALREPMRLSALRGQTVVLAFFPGARTPGCTIQMEKYRDSYGSLFLNGANVVVLGMSVDPDTTLGSWAREAHFPMLFASDAGGNVGTAYGAYDTGYKLEHRLLYVVGPDGRIAYVAKPFDVSKPESYAMLGAAIQAATPPTPTPTPLH